MANIIFDFDGTIADSFEVVVGIVHELTGQDEQLPADDIERLRSMTLLQAAKELHIRPWKIPLLLARGRQQMRSKMDSVQAFGGMPKVIKKLSATHKLYIMSSNSLQNIELFLQRHDLDNEFIQLYGGVGLLGKAMVLRRIIRQNRIDPEDTYYVGDEVRDVEAAKRCGVHAVAVAWGYNTAEVLGDHLPDYIVGKPSELLKIF